MGPRLRRSQPRARRAARGEPRAGRLLWREVDCYRRALELPAGRELHWVPRYLPFQLLGLGSLFIATLPHEVTTVSGG